MAEVATPTLKESIQAAVATEIKPPESEVPETSVVEPEKPVEIEKVDFTEELKSAQSLYNLLKDPEKGKEIALYLAAKFGVLPQGATKQEEKKVVKALTERLKEAIPESYRDLMGDWLPGVMEILKEEITGEVRGELSELQKVNIKREVDSEISEFYKTNPDAKLYDKEMAELAKRMPQGEGLSLQEYMSNLYTIASKNKEAGRSVKEVVDKINRNEKKSVVRGSEVSEKVVQMGSKLPTLKEAVRAASRGERLVK